MTHPLPGIIHTRRPFIKNQMKIQSKSNLKSKSKPENQKSKPAFKTKNNHPKENPNKKARKTRSSIQAPKPKTKKKSSVQSKSKRQISQTIALQFIIIQSMPRGYLRPRTCVNDLVARQWFVTYFIISGSIDNQSTIIPEPHIITL